MKQRDIIDLVLIKDLPMLNSLMEIALGMAKVFRGI
jgi:hypothetical protein